MIKKILMAGRGDRATGPVAPATRSVVRASHTGDFTPMETRRV